MEWKLRQVGVVVKDLDKAIEYYSSVFGIEPFRKTEVLLPKAEVRGKPCQLPLKLAFARLGEISLELIQAEPGENIYWEFLQSKGEGLHHLGFYVEDLNTELAPLKAKGVQVLQSGVTDGGGFAYLDSTAFGGSILELIQRA
jgi:catechol 2,3-dioxygenase-like lactoylglutathione lyase family enzyme